MQQTFLYISLPLMHDYNMKIPSFSLYQQREQAIAKLLTWIWFLGIQLQKSSLAFDKISDLELLQQSWKEHKFTFCGMFLWPSPL